MKTRPSFSGAKGTPIAIARGTITAACASRLTPRPNSSAAPGEEREPEPEPVHRQLRPQGSAALLEPGDRAEREPDDHGPGGADRDRHDVRRLQVRTAPAVAAQVGEADHGQDRRQHHRTPTAQRLAAELAEDDPADDGDDRENLEPGHEVSPQRSFRPGQAGRPVRPTE
jgi:hypothetical protein